MVKRNNGGKRCGEQGRNGGWLAGAAGAAGLHHAGYAVRGMLGAAHRLACGRILGAPLGGKGQAGLPSQCGLLARRGRSCILTLAAKTWHYPLTARRHREAR